MPFFSEVTRLSYKMKSGDTCFVMYLTSRTFAIVADENVLTNTHINPSHVGQKMPLFTTRVETLVADKHATAKLPLVPFWIIKLIHLTAGICMKVRFRSKVTRGFSFVPLCDSCSPLGGSLMRWEIQKNFWDQGICHRIPIHCEFLTALPTHQDGAKNSDKAH